MQSKSIELSDADQERVAAADAKVAAAKEALQTPAVESVSAINAKELKVVFNTEVDKTTAENAANYVLKLNTV